MALATGQAPIRIIVNKIALSSTRHSMLPNFSNLSVGVATAPRPPLQNPKPPVDKTIRKKLRGASVQTMDDRGIKEWATQIKKSVEAHFPSTEDHLANGIGYRCEDVLFELLNGTHQDDGRGRCLHMAWDQFHTEYGSWCAMFSTRALENCDFEMMHGYRWKTKQCVPDDAKHLLFTSSEGRKWLRKEYIPGGDDKKGDELIKLWDQGNIDDPQLKIPSAPWWILRCATADLIEQHESFIPEFAVSSPNGDPDRLTKIASCIVGIVKFDLADDLENRDRLIETYSEVYRLPPNVKPGSQEAQQHATKFMLDHLFGGIATTPVYRGASGEGALETCLQGGHFSWDRETAEGYANPEDYSSGFEIQTTALCLYKAGATLKHGEQWREFYDGFCIDAPEKPEHWDDMLMLVELWKHATKIGQITDSDASLPRTDNGFLQTLYWKRPDPTQQTLLEQLQSVYETPPLDWNSPETTDWNSPLLRDWKTAVHAAIQAAPWNVNPSLLSFVRKLHGNRYPPLGFGVVYTPSRRRSS